MNKKKTEIGPVCNHAPNIKGKISVAVFAKIFKPISWLENSLQ
jgi:hypothetical protein